VFLEKVLKISENVAQFIRDENSHDNLCAFQPKFITTDTDIVKRQQNAEQKLLSGVGMNKLN